MKACWVVRQAPILIACLGTALGLAGSLYLLTDQLGYYTVYSPSYNESRFDSIMIGMSSRQVEAIMGSPLKKTFQVYQGGDEMWAFSDQPTITSDYWRRWIIFEKGRASVIVKDFWLD